MIRNDRQATLGPDHHWRNSERNRKQACQANSLSQILNSSRKHLIIANRPPPITSKTIKAPSVCSPSRSLQVPAISFTHRASCKRRILRRSLSAPRTITPIALKTSATAKVTPLEKTKANYRQHQSIPRSGDFSASHACGDPGNEPIDRHHKMDHQRLANQKIGRSPPLCSRHKDWGGEAEKN